VLVGERPGGSFASRSSGDARREAARHAVTVAIVTVVGLALCGAMLVPVSRMLADSVGVDDTLGPLRALRQRSTIVARDGTTPVGVLGTQDRQDVSLDQVPRVVIDAVVDTEDATFWTNPGVDLAAMARSLLTNLASGRVEEGGSTITQQLVKNRLLDDRRDVHRKLAEVSLAIQLHERYSRRRILQEYLNTVYFGQGAYGIKVAAERFFVTTDPTTGGTRGKRLDELTAADAALLAGVISSPERDNPFTAPERARARRALVLDRMVTHGHLSRAAADRAAAAPLPTQPPPVDLRPRDYFTDEVQRSLLADPRLGRTEAQRRRRLLSGGLRIVATIDPFAQQRAEAAVAQILPDDARFTAALVAMDPSSGQVLAVVGGPGFDRFQYDLATHQPGRQPGSTFKLITLAAALEAGYSPDDTLDGSSPCTATRPPLEPWTTSNAEPGGGVETLRDATAGSVNCAFAHLIASLGPAAVVDMAHRLGVTQNVPAYLSITLGTLETTPLEMATVASTLANRGLRHDPVFVQTVTAPDGQVLVDNTQRTGTRALSPEIVDCENDLLRGVVDRGTGTNAQVPGYDVVGKTGTTDNKADAWFVGFTPNLAATVWMGAPDAAVPMTDVGGIEVFGGTYPAQIWQAFAAAMLTGTTPAVFPPGGPVCDRPGTFVSDAPRRGFSGPGRGSGGGSGSGTGNSTAPSTEPPIEPPTAPPAAAPAPGSAPVSPPTAPSPPVTAPAPSPPVTAPAPAPPVTGDGPPAT
jgi:penicillin-binding protein 1A